MSKSNNPEPPADPTTEATPETTSQPEYKPITMTWFEQAHKLGVLGKKEILAVGILGRIVEVVVTPPGQAETPVPELIKKYRSLSIPELVLKKPKVVDLIDFSITAQLRRVFGYPPPYDPPPIPDPPFPKDMLDEDEEEEFTETEEESTEKGEEGSSSEAETTGENNPPEATAAEANPATTPEPE